MSFLNSLLNYHLILYVYSSFLKRLGINGLSVTCSLTFAAEINQKTDMQTIETLMQKARNNRRLSDVLFILWAGGAALLSYSLVYALRKPFTAATFDGLDFFGMDYKTAASMVQISGYFLSKLIGIKVISELKKENRLRFILLSVAVAQLSLVLFGALPCPYNVFALFFNGLSLGCMWGVIFSFLEGRRTTDLLGALMGLSIAISSGTAKSVGLFVMDGLHISEFWMPAFIGAFAFPLLSLLGWLMNKMPRPTAADMALRTERVTLDRRARAALFKDFMPVLLLLFCANLFITILQDIKEDFLVKILDVEAAGLSSWAFAKVDATVTVIILCLFGLMALVKSNVRALCLLLLLVTCGAGVLSFVAFHYDSLQLPPMLWLFLQSLSLYTVYLSFQTLFFERFIACFRIRGNVGFFIITLDFIGYTGTVVVLACKELFTPEVDWLSFYNLMAGYVGVVCCVAFAASAVYIVQRYRRECQDWKSVAPCREGRLQLADCCQSV